MTPSPDNTLVVPETPSLSSVDRVLSTSEQESSEEEELLHASIKVERAQVTIAVIAGDRSHLLAKNCDGDGVNCRFAFICA
jgi:hypothetical protein